MYSHCLFSKKLKNVSQVLLKMLFAGLLAHNLDNFPDCYKRLCYQFLKTDISEMCAVCFCFFAQSSSPSPVPGSPFRNFPNKWPKVSPQAGPSALSPVPFLSSPLYDEMECEDEQSFEEISHGIPPPVIEDVISNEFCLSLEDRGKTRSFTVTYHDLPEKGYSGNYMCFVRLDTRPPTVCSGMGPTKAYAHEKAAKNALLYLNTVSLNAVS